MNAARILIVDDEEHIRLLYRTELEAAGYDVEELPNGSRLLETIEEQRPDLMVLDIRMPGPSGLELLKSVRSRHRRIPIVLSSAYSSYQGDMRTLPADAYVLKSSDLGPLLETVRALLAERELELASPPTATAQLGWMDHSPSSVPPRPPGRARGAKVRRGR